MNTTYLIQGDARHLPLADNSVDSVVCDPPYGLEFMGKEWDAPWRADGFAGWKDKGFRSLPSWGVSRNPTCQRCKLRTRGKSKCKCDDPVWDQTQQQTRTILNAQFGEWSLSWLKDSIRVLKPGGHLLAFGGTRMFHRLAVAIEDAGFEIRDCLMWLYGSGFPKSKNIGDGRGTALKPAWEPIIMARKPLSEGTVEANVARWGVGCIWIDALRISVTDADYARNCSGDRGHADNRARDMEFAMGCRKASDLGRWPANLMLDEVAADALDLQTGVLKSGLMAAGQQRNASRGGGGYHGNFPDQATASETYGDSGGASRFFYVAKASSAERNAGCDAPPQRVISVWGGDEDDLSDGKKSTVAKGNHHPTVKPSQLMRYLCKLVTPPGGTVLDCFVGSGSTGIAAVWEGFNFIGVEREREYLDIAKARTTWAARNPQGEQVEWPRAKVVPLCPEPASTWSLFASPTGVSAVSGPATGGTTR